MAGQATGESWKNETIPNKQYALANKELEDLRNGKPNIVWQTICDTINEHIPEEINTILDLGCASGYFHEVFRRLLKNNFAYVGADYSKEMIKLANKNYPDVGFINFDVRCIELPDRSQDFVFSNAVLEHVPEWKKGLSELCRITDKYLMLSKMPADKNIFRTQQKKIYDGVPVFFNKFNYEEIIEIVSSEGFELICEKKTHPAPNNIYRIFVFRRGE
jgi:ubiquinone/menaquinone biosynthesis C-methylase UbiE